jgi:hypothetical protein
MDLILTEIKKINQAISHEFQDALKERELWEIKDLALSEIKNE